jgi:exodeoxyribonuclease V alpha subunit
MHGAADREQDHVGIRYDAVIGRQSIEASKPTTDRAPISELVERVTYHNPDNGFCVLRLKVRGHRDLVTLVGSTASVAPGEYVTASGRRDTSRDHGLQFRATFLRSAPPTIEDIERYLGSGLIKGIASVREAARVRIRRRGLRHHRAGAGPADDRARHRSRASEADHGQLGRPEGNPRDHGLPTIARRQHVGGRSNLQDYRGDAIPLVSENPYRLARDIRGIGFLTADTIAQKLGIEKTAMIRARAGISYALNEARLPSGDLKILSRHLRTMAFGILWPLVTFCARRFWCRASSLCVALPARCWFWRRSSASSPTSY